MGRVSFVLLFLLLTPFVLAENKTYQSLFQFKQGQLNEDETWSGKILLLSDVLIPEDIELTISPDSWIIYNEMDLNNQGNDPLKPEIISYGVLTITDNNSVKLYSLGDPEVQQYIDQQAGLESVAITPKPEPLTDLERDLHKSKRAYAWLWVLIYSIWLVL